MFLNCVVAFGVKITMEPNLAEFRKASSVSITPVATTSFLVLNTINC